MRGQLWPRRFDFSHYNYVFDKIDTLPLNLWNSIYVTGATVLITTVAAVLAGYALVHLKPKGGTTPTRFTPFVGPFGGAVAGLFRTSSTGFCFALTIDRSLGKTVVVQRVTVRWCL